MFALYEEQGAVAVSSQRSIRRAAVCDFGASYNAEWLIEKRGFRWGGTAVPGKNPASCLDCNPVIRMQGGAYPVPLRAVSRALQPHMAATHQDAHRKAKAYRPLFRKVASTAEMVPI